MGSAAPSVGGQLAAGPSAPSGRPAGALLVGAVFLVAACAFLFTGSAAIALAPTVVVLVGYAFWAAPLRHTIAVFFLLGVSIDALPGASGAEGVPAWRPPIAPLATILFENLHKVTGIGALRFSLSEVLLGLMIVVAVARTVTGRRTDRTGRMPGASPIYVTAALMLATVIGLELWGIARGGDFRQSLWQFRQMLWFPAYVGLFSYAMRGPGDARLAAYLLTAGACFKLLLGAYFLMAIAWPAGLEPPVMTSHADSVVFVTVALIWFTAWIHEPTRARLIPALLFCSLMMTALLLNNRRIAFVGLLGGMALLVVILRGPVKRTIVRAVIMTLPLTFLYLAAGRHRSTGVFKPASLVMSVVDQEDGSSKTRDIENYNLIQTLKPQKLLGSGWGHEYRELVVAYDISNHFAQYRYIPHNSVLWLFTVGGIVGFTFLWLPVAVGVFFARRCYYFARNGYERTVAAVALAVCLLYVIQAWGDMGTQGMSCALILAWALASVGKLAVANGAWPEGLRLVAFGRAQPRRAPGGQP